MMKIARYQEHVGKRKMYSSFRGQFIHVCNRIIDYQESKEKRVLFVLLKGFRRYFKGLILEGIEQSEQEQLQVQHRVCRQIVSF